MSTPNQNVNQTDIFQQYEEAVRKSGRYLKMLSGEKRTLQFNLQKVVIKDTEYLGHKTGGQTIEFTVIDPREPQIERILPMGARKAKGIMDLLKAGRFLLDITKIGTGPDSQFLATAL
jgi:hypothetical protein